MKIARCRSLNKCLLMLPVLCALPRQSVFVLAPNPARQTARAPAVFHQVGQHRGGFPRQTIAGTDWGELFRPRGVIVAPVGQFGFKQVAPAGADKIAGVFKVFCRRNQQGVAVLAQRGQRQRFVLLEGQGVEPVENGCLGLMMAMLRLTSYMGGSPNRQVYSAASWFSRVKSRCAQCADNRNRALAPQGKTHTARPV